MRGRVILLCGALAGCGVLTGLDVLKVADDASSTLDASDDASDDGDAPATVDVSTPDAADASDAPTSSGIVHCGTSTCSGGMACCIVVSNQTTYSCAKDCNIQTTTLTLHCDDESDCNNNGQSGQTCCLANGVAQCLIAATCANELCATAQQCPNNGKCSPFDAGGGVTLSRCQ